jgi:hypothetical protein
MIITQSQNDHFTKDNSPKATILRTTTLRRQPILKSSVVEPNLIKLQLYAAMQKFRKGKYNLELAIPIKNKLYNEIEISREMTEKRKLKIR